MAAKNELTAEEIRFMSQVIEALKPKVRKVVKDIKISCIEYTKWRKLRVSLDLRASSMQTYGFGINAPCIKVLADLVKAMVETFKEFNLVITHVELEHWDRGCLTVMADLETPFPETSATSFDPSLRKDGK